MDIVEILKALILGVIQGITEWLPISSTGHMILFDSFWPLDPTRYSGGKEFINLFLVVIQFGSILAVVLIYFHKLNPFSSKKNAQQKKETFSIWGKIIVASFPAAIAGLLFKDVIHEYFYNTIVVSAMLILYGIFFIIIENRNNNTYIKSIDNLDYKTAFVIGMFQMMALIPGTSRSGATIVGALLFGCSRMMGAEFSFFLAIPAMLGASVLEIGSYFKKYGIGFTPNEFGVLITGMIVAFFVSIFAISFLMSFIRKNSFKPFAFYRIIIGSLILILSLSGALQLAN